MIMIPLWENKALGELRVDYEWMSAVTNQLVVISDE